MAASSLLIRNARALTMTGSASLTETDSLLGIVDTAEILIRDGVIEWVRPAAAGTNGIDPAVPSDATALDAKGCCVLPAFVDCHTHACWAGDRLDEWQRKLAGASYLELLAAGGGIMSTVRAVRAAPQQQLSELLLRRLWTMLREGTTTAEVKSGYGLSTESELKMLRAIADAATQWPGRVVPTACIGHALDPDLDRATFVERTIRETLPAVSAEFPGITMDAYCEEGAWSLTDASRLLDAAQAAGHPIRVHADQFYALGMVDTAIERGYRSVDHLEATGQDALRRLAASPCFGVMLPCSGFHVDGRYANGRTFWDAGGNLALATNYNPGTGPSPSIPMAMALAVRHLGLTHAEALVASTANPARLLGYDDLGAIQHGYAGDLVVLDVSDPRWLAFEIGISHIQTVICKGHVV